MDNRLKVIGLFFKNHHNYMKNYELEAKSLSAGIMSWWEELKTTKGGMSTNFGRPTGIYTLIVLMSWWCSLLKGRPDNELVNCLRTIEDVDRAILSAVCSLPPPPPGVSTTLPTPKPHGLKKRASSKQQSSGPKK